GVDPRVVGQGRPERSLGEVWIPIRFLEIEQGRPGSGRRAEGRLVHVEPNQALLRRASTGRGNVRGEIVNLRAYEPAQIRTGGVAIRRHRSSLSSEETRISVAPAARSCSIDSQKTSSWIAICTAIHPGIWSGTTVGA